MKARGFSLVEVAMAALIAALGALLVGTLLRVSTSTTKQESERSELVDTLGMIAEQIVRQGRIARLCYVENLNTLVCRGHYSSSDTDDTRAVRYRWDSTTNILYQEGRVDPADPWTGEREYPNFSDFTVCGDLEMAGGTCPLEPQLLTTQHVSLLSPPNATVPNTFFRLRLRMRLDSITSQIQTAFHARNPTPYADTSSTGGYVEYRWGSQ